MSSIKGYSESGQPIYQYEERIPPTDSLIPIPEELELIDQHIETYLGPVHMVWHELVSEIVHIDVHHIKPTDSRPFQTLVTSGMSDRPMNAPSGAEEFRFAELVMTLPADWPIGEEEFKDEANWWPIRLLKMLARFPHEFNTWLWWGHSMPNGDPPAAWHESTKQSGVVLLGPTMVPDDFHMLDCGEEKKIHFLSVVPVYTEEMNAKLKYGTEYLTELFVKNDIDDIVNPNRKNVCKKWWQLG